MTLSKLPAHRPLAQLAMWVLIATFAAAAPVTAADGPTPYPDAKKEADWPGKGPIRTFAWMVDNRASFWKLREKDQGAVVLVGDSLTAGWNAKVLIDAFPKMKIANRGIGGDTSRGLLFRFKEDVLDLKPRAIVLCIGTNDLSAHGDPKDIELNITDMIAQARQQDPKVPIVLCLIPPRDVANAPTKPGALADLNDRITKLGANQEHFVTLDLFKAMATADGKPVEELFAKDRIHLAAPGYKKWAEQLKPALEKLGVK